MFSLKSIIVTNVGEVLKARIPIMFIYTLCIRNIKTFLARLSCFIIFNSMRNRDDRMVRVMENTETETLGSVQINYQKYQKLLLQSQDFVF